MVDAVIRLFLANETDYSTNGEGYLTEATACMVKEDRNGSFELEMKYPITGKRYKDISLRSLIVAKPNPYDDPQPFRVYEISRPLKGVVTIRAEHISYDLSGIPVTGGWSAPTISSALQGLKSHAVTTCPFNFWTDTTTKASFSVNKPTNIRTLLGGTEGSILDVFGGEYKFDRQDVKLYGARGSDLGVTIRYGKNLTDLNQEENCASVYTGIYPFWYSESDGTKTLVECSPKIVSASGTFNFEKILVVDFSSAFQDPPTPSQLKSRAQQYVKDNDIGIPSVSLDVSFVTLADSGEYDTIAMLETVHLCDRVTVIFEELGVKASAKVISTTYNCLTDKYESVELGDARANIAATISNTAKEIQKSSDSTKTDLQRAIEHATNLITGNLGGYVVIRSSTGGKEPDEILIMDTPDVTTAKMVWRWNKSGLGFSSNGYNGPFATAITYDGHIVADMITAGTFNGAYIRGGTVSADKLTVEYKNSVTTQIDNMGGKVTEELTTRIENTDRMIQLEVSNVKTDVNNLRTSTSSSITMLSNQITLKVTADQVSSMITQSADSIRLKASKISWEADYSSMTEDGKLTCQNADVAGTVLCGKQTGNNRWIRLTNSGDITGGVGENQYGYMNFACSIRLSSTGATYRGAQILSPAFALRTAYMTTINSSSTSVNPILVRTQYVKFIESITFDASGLTWYEGRMRFINGMLVTASNSG